MTCHFKLGIYRIVEQSDAGDDSELREEDHLQHPSRRVGKPEDIARACVFLSTPGNDFINGADLVIDGGMTRKMIYIP